VYCASENPETKKNSISTDLAIRCVIPIENPILEGITID